MPRPRAERSPDSGAMTPILATLSLLEPDPVLACHLVFEQSLNLMVPVDHPFAQRDHIEARELGGLFRDLDKARAEGDEVRTVKLQQQIDPRQVHAVGAGGRAYRGSRL